MVHRGGRSEAWRPLCTFKMRHKSVWLLSFSDYVACSDSLLMTVSNGVDNSAICILWNW